MLDDTNLEKIFEKMGVGCTAEDAATTRDTMADFVAAQGTPSTQKEVNGLPCAIWRKIQPGGPGSRRVDLYVVDAGDVRYAVKF